MSEHNQSLSGLFREPLPEKCPPVEATDISSLLTVYRLVESIPPSADDFASHQAKKPHAKYPNPCKARGLSVLPTIAAAERTKKLPTLRHRTLLICTVRLVKDSGMILREGNEHWTWWPFAMCDVLACCEVMT